MRLFTDVFDKGLLTPGRKIEVLDMEASIPAEIVAEVGGGHYTASLGEGPDVGVHIDYIERIDATDTLWYYSVTEGVDKVTSRPTGYYLGRDDIVLGECITGTKEEVIELLQDAKFGEANIDRLTEGVLGNNQRPEDELEGGTAMGSVDDVDGLNTGWAGQIPAPKTVERKPCPECGKVLNWMADGSRPRAHKCEPKAQEAQEAMHQDLPSGPSNSLNKAWADRVDSAGQEPVKNVITADAVIAKYIETRDQIAAEKKIFDEKVAGLKKYQVAREGWLATAMDKLGMTSFKKAGIGIAFFNFKSSATIADADAFTDWVQEDWKGRNHFLDRKVNKTAVKDAVDEGNTPPPGTNYTTVRVVQINKG